MPFDEITSLERQLKNKHDNLLLLQERMSKYALDTDIPLDLVREEREHQAEIADLEARIAQLKAEKGAKVFPAPTASRFPSWIWLPALGVVVAVVAIATLWSSLSNTLSPPNGATMTAAALASTATSAVPPASATLPAEATLTATAEATPVAVLPTEAPPTPYPSGATPDTTSPDEFPTVSPALSVAELEPMLAEVNILLSSGNEQDFVAMRSYFQGPDSAYNLLSSASLHVLHGYHLVKTVYLDMIDDFYTRLRGGEDQYLTASGAIDEETVRQAIVAAHNEYYGEAVVSFDDLIAPGPKP